MQRSELPLYPKTTSIYNKILQLGIAILLMVAIFSFWFTSFQQTQDEIGTQFKHTGRNYVDQVVVTIKVLMKNKRTKELKELIASLDKAPLIQQARLYDNNGVLVAQTSDSQSVKALYGLEEETTPVADNFVPFVAEIRDGELLGYLRVNLKRELITKPLDNKLSDQAKSVSVMLVLAALAGFLLTRGLTRFSRKQLDVGHPSNKN